MVPNKEMHTMKITFDEIQWERIYEYFKAYTHVDYKEIPEEFADYVVPTKKLMEEQAEVILKYRILDVTEKKEDGIVLENGGFLQAKILGKALKDAKQVLLFVSSVINVDDILSVHPDMMETFFLEYWAVSMLRSAKEQLMTHLEQELSGSDLKKTSLWSPGQANISLNNQKVLFEALKPEQEGIILDKHMRMIPLKSVSGIVGIVPKEADISMISCDFCEHAKICPGYEGVKYKDIQDRRLV